MIKYLPDVCFLLFCFAAGFQVKTIAYFSADS